MAAAHIPATTLTYKGTYSELSAKLLEREIGWCTDDNILYVKGANGLVPLSEAVIIDDSATLQSVHDYVSRGIIPMMKVEVVPGSPDSGDAYLTLQHIDGERAVFARVFGSYVQYVSWSDGTWVPQQITLGGISAVAHDASLAGNGTESNPLKVAQPDAPENGLAYFRKDGEWATTGDLATATVDEMAYGEIAVQVPPSAPGTVTIAGKEYRTVVIGDQEWLAENLDVELGELGTDCFMYNNDPEMRAKYGLLYKWTTLCSGNEQPSAALSAILPDGWRLPSESDFANLIDFAGGGEAAGAKLKSSSSDWTSSSRGSDDFGFSALPGGMWNDGFFNAGQAAYYWTATQDETPFATMVYITTSPGCYYDYYRTSRAYSVRLVRDYDPSAPRTVKATVQDIVKAGTDSELSAISENPVQNKVIYEAIGNVEALLAAL